MEDTKAIEKRLGELNRHIIRLMLKGASHDELLKSKEERSLLELRLEKAMDKEDPVRKAIRDMRHNLIGKRSDCQKMIDDYRADARTLLTKILRLQKDHRMEFAEDRRQSVFVSGEYIALYVYGVELLSGLSSDIMVFGEYHTYGGMEKVSITRLDFQSLEDIVSEVMSQYENGDDGKPSAPVPIEAEWGHKAKESQ